MIRTVVQSNLYVNDAVAGENAALHSALDTGVNRRNEFLRDCTARNGIDKFISAAGFAGFNRDLNMAVLTFTAGLTGILGFLIHFFADGFLVSNLRSTDVCFHLEFAEQTVNDDFQMKFAHTGNDGLTGFFIGVGAESRVFFCEFRKSNAHLFLTGLGFGFNGNADNRFREHHGFQNDRMIFVAERIAGGGIFGRSNGRDIARINFVDIGSFVCMHLQNTAETFMLVFRRVINVRTFHNDTRIYAEEAKLSDERVGHDLECQRGERRFVGRRAFVLFLGFGVYTLDSGNVERRRHIVDNRVEQFLHALILIGSAADNRNDLVGDNGLAKSGFQFGNRQFLTVAILFKQFFVGFGNRLNHLASVLFGHLHHIRGNFFHAHILTEIVVIYVGFHLHKINDAAERSFGTDRELNRNSIGFQSFFQHLDNAEEVRARDVHLVDIAHTRNVIFVGLTPYRFGLGFNAALGAKNRDGTVKNAERTLYFDGKVNVAGRVDNIDAAGVRFGFCRVIVIAAGRPVAGRSGRRDRNAAFLFLRHPVHRSGAVMNFADAVGFAGIKQDTFGGGGFTSIDMRHNTDITGIGK